MSEFTSESFFWPNRNLRGQGRARAPPLVRFSDDFAEGIMRGIGVQPGEGADLRKLAAGVDMLEE